MKLDALLMAALAELHPMARVSAALSDLVPEMEIHLIAIGKGAPAMARGAMLAWESHITRSLIVTSDDVDDLGLEVLRAGHPVPDSRSVDAADLCLDFAARAPSLLACISGGASSLVCAPSEGVTLKTKQLLTKALLSSGARISDVNTVRKHLSRIKGGGLARAAGEVPVFTLIMSDVVKGTMDDVGSGPTLADTSNVAEAKKIVKKYAPEFLKLPFVKTGDVPNSVDARVVVAPDDLARKMSSRLRQKGFTVSLRKPTQAPVTQVAKELLAAAKKMAPGEALIGVGEPSLKIPPEATGRGGRNSHLAALVGKELPSGYQFGAFATDGVDGSSGTAGAIVDGAFVERAGSDTIAREIARFNTGPLHLAAGTALMENPTGHNLADLHVLVRLP